MIDLGSTVPLGVTITDANGNPADATNVTVTITLPDNTVTTPAVSHDGTGAYSCQYVTTQAGRHQVRWTSAVPATTYTDVFNVTPSTTVALISVAEARNALARRPGSSASVLDDDLRAYIAAATPIVEDAAGPQRIITKTVTVDGGQPAVLLPDSVLAVVSVTESGAALTAGSDFTVDPARGILSRGNYAGYAAAFAPGLQNIVVTYTTGVGIIADNIRLAARIIVAHLWQADQQGYRPALGGAPNPDVVTTPSGFAIPRRAAELLQPSTDSYEMPGFA